MNMDELLVRVELICEHFLYVVKVSNVITTIIEFLVYSDLVAHSTLVLLAMVYVLPICLIEGDT